MRGSIIEAKRSDLSIASDDFEVMHRTLSSLSSPTMNYDDFVTFQAKRAPNTMARFFTSQNYLMFPKDERGEILVESFLRFVKRSLDVEVISLQLIAQVHSNDSSLGFINEQELERFILAKIPEVGACQELPESFYPYYVFTASRRFLFFLDSRRTRRISVKKLAHSAVMEELLFLQRISQHADYIDQQTANQIASNWFSGSNALRVFSLYVELDSDQNGMLNQDELGAFTGPNNDQVQLTRTAVRRIFEENITYHPMEMDYKVSSVGDASNPHIPHTHPGPPIPRTPRTPHTPQTFLDLYLALEYKSTVEAMTYFWRVLDIDKCGKLTSAAIR